MSYIEDMDIRRGLSEADRMESALASSDEEILRLAEENKALREQLERRDRDLAALKEHIGNWKRETLAKLRQDFVIEEAVTPQGWDGFQAALDRILPEGGEG